MIPEIKGLLKLNKEEELNEAMKKMHPADIADALFNLDTKEQIAFISRIDKKQMIKVFNELTENDVDVTFLHSMSVKLDKPPDGRRKKKQVSPAEEKKPEEGITYNCTIRVPKQYILPMFNDKAGRMQKVAEILAEVALRAYKEDCQNAAQKGDLSSMSRSS